jgi:hypothetical protein
LEATGTRPRAFVDGIEVARLAGPYGYVNPTRVYDGICSTGLYGNFYIGEWLFYEAPTAAQMETYTAASRARWIA